ncbi:MAG: enediyne polyketide synthase [Sphingomonadales bacterium]|jgi:enediyne polyketide synthase|nr:enediyne polyketide synthase [Sphingomonadales bacterium]
MSDDGAGIVIAGMACRYPDADDPQALMRNTVDGRLSFRPIPPERLALDDYAACLVGEADSIVSVPAGLLTDWRFDAARFRVPRATVESSDLAHWLALEVAADAIDDAGGRAALDPERTAVIVANTLTGEFSRAALLRMRWPWLDRQLARALNGAGVDSEAAAAARGAFRGRVRGAFPAPDEESLAGGLANTIAGRIANHFDLHGGAWAVDGACASSLVAVATAGDLIAAGRASAVVVAAVDLSLDPFELVGFSRNGALARGRMRVFDARAEGFWPGEGAGALVLVAAPAARRKGLPDRARLAGWGIASDGSGGLTRPDASGQHRALVRAYAAAGIDPSELGYIEAHGTGTAVGDPTEVRALARLVGDGRPSPLALGSIKANIGHTKAAAGLAGLIRATVAMIDGIVPPHAGCEQLHPVFAETGNRLRVPDAAEAWRAGARRVAGISSFGFGGVNAHAVVTAPGRRPARSIPAAPPTRNGDLFLFRGADAAANRASLSALAARASRLSFAELGDAARAGAAALGEGPLRLAFVASTPAELVRRIAAAEAALDGAAPDGIRLARVDRAPRIGLVFPGQGAPVRPDGGAWARRFPGRYPPLALLGDPLRTDNAQPAIARAALAGLDLLARLGVGADAAIGHSVGELAALTWAGAIDPAGLLSIVRERGRIMATQEAGAMLRLDCDPAAAAWLGRGLPAVAACLNAAAETIMAGPFPAIDELEARAIAAGIASLRLAVSHAFHSPMMSPTRAPFAAALGGLEVKPPDRPVVSTVTGKWLAAGVDLRALLIDQLTRPVLFAEAAGRLAERVDAMVEVGPAAGFARLLSGFGKAVVSLDVFGEDFPATLDALASLFALGVDLDPSTLTEGPSIRPLPAAPPVLLASPCGLSGDAAAPLCAAPAETPADPTPGTAPMVGPLDLLIAMVAEETGLAAAALSPDDRFLQDLHLNSLAVSRLVARLAGALGRRAPGPPTAFAEARLRDVADALEEAEAIGAADAARRVAGVARWVRRFRVSTAALEERPQTSLRWHRCPLGSPSHAAADGLAIELGGWDAARQAAPLLRLCQEAVGRYAHLAIRHDGAPLSGFARSIAAERLFDSVRLIHQECGDAPLSRAVSGFEEIVPDSNGRAAMPLLELAAETATARPHETGTILVTGGAHGIAAECAIRIAAVHRRPVILAGRRPPGDERVAATIARIAAGGGRACYVQADVTDAAALARGVAEAAAELGDVALLIHAAGINEPAPFARIDALLLGRTLGPKAAGLLAAVDACGDSVRRVVAFGSIIARLGLSGEAHYALANAEQTRLLGEIAARRPALSALSIEWSVWAGVGMGERLGAIDRLAADGVDAISLDQALAEFEALALSDAEGALVVTSRYGSNAPAAAPEPLRFVDRQLLHTPGVELVAATEIAMGRDPYLLDHRISGGALMPGVMLIEGMAQAALALTGARPSRFDNVRFAEPLHVGSGRVPIRIGALREAGGTVRTEIRSDQNGFADPVAEAGVRFGTGRRPAAPPPVPATVDAAPLYGPLFFHGPRFQRIAGLGALSSRKLAAAFAPVGRTDWFGSFEPQTLVTGYPDFRDAALHVLQCCVPHRRVVPESTARVELYPGGPPVRVHASEVRCGDGEYVFDILLVDAAGAVVERWREAAFRAIEAIDIVPVLAAVPQLATAWLERRARETTGDETLVLALVDDAAGTRENRRDRAAAALGLPAAPARRGDGRPARAAYGRCVSFAHAGGVTLAVSSARAVGCDIEKAAAFAADELALAWTAGEALRKIGSTADVVAREPGLFTGDDREQIAAFGPMPTAGAGMVVVAVGTAPPP